MRLNHHLHILLRRSEDLLVAELRRPTPWVETVVITSLACLIGWWASPEDPLLLESPFPWLWFAPVMIALRYGVMPGIFSALGLLIDWGMATEILAADDSLPRAWFIGGLLMTLIAGEFNAVWQDRLMQRDEANLYLSERLNRLSRRYMLLRLSHDRIEQELLVKPGSLRDALLRLRELSPGANDATPLPDIDTLLQLMSQYCQLESASIHTPPRMTATGHWQLEPPLASLGHPATPASDNAMLHEAIERRALVHVAQEGMEDAQFLLIAPIISADDKLLGVLAVNQMPFFALNHENLQLLDLLLGYYADVINTGSEAQALRRQLPGSPWAFIEELVRVRHIEQRIGIASHVVVLRFRGDSAHEIAGEVERMRRGLDVFWSNKEGKEPVLAALLPLSSGAASEGYILRIERWLEERYGIENNSPLYAIEDIELGHADALERLSRAMHTTEETA